MASEASGPPARRRRRPRPRRAGRPAPAARWRCRILPPPASTTTASGRNAMSPVQWSDNAPIYRQLKEREIAMMLDGELKPGDALPAGRQVAADVRRHPTTGAGAYHE